MRALPYAAVIAVAAVVPAVLAAQNVKVMTTENRDRAALGVSTASGGARDTIGVLVADVTVGGPADKAGIQEGDRIVSIGDVDLRLAAADATEGEMRGVMTRRLAHALAKHAAGDVVELRVYHDGQFVSRKVTTAKASEVFVMPVVEFGDLGDHVRQWGNNADEMGRFMDRVKVMPIPPVPPMPQFDSGAFRFQIYDNGRHRI
jgi:predicted metalloprotease with PDZ domain